MAIQNSFIFLFLSLVHAQNYCPGSYCNGTSISFPFWLQGQKLPQNCGLIGFNLSCNAQKKAILSTPYSGDFYVTSIYYYLKRIELVDPDNCLPRRLLSLNLSSSPFKAASYQSYTFLSCPKGFVSRYVVDCISNATTDIVAIRKEADVVKFTRCRKIFTLQIPDSYDYSYAFPVNLELTWDVPATGSEKEELSHTAIVLSLVAASAIIPVVIVVISCCICMLRRDDPQSGSNRAGSSDTVAAGLDQYTIGTYRKIRIGQNCRVEGPNDITCTICLADYVPNDTIRFMPECQHCFHVKCIDKWLSMKGKCPICRAS